MNLKQQIDSDLKSAMLAGDKALTTTLRGLKSAILYVEVAGGKREEGLPDQEIVNVLRKEAKKRQESAELFAKGGNAEKAEAERQELTVIEKYLPAQLSDEQLDALVDAAVAEAGNVTPQMMGQIIGRVKEQGKGNADGARIAKAVKERLQK